MFGRVYFIFQVGNDDCCKINKTLNPEKDLELLQPCNPDRLYIYRTFRGYKSLEAKFHKYFEEGRINEYNWFEVSKDDVDSLYIENGEIQMRVDYCTCLDNSENEQNYAESELAVQYGEPGVNELNEEAE